MKFIKTMVKEKTSKVNSNLSAPAPHKPRRTMLALEPRIMFDGAAVETAYAGRGLQPRSYRFR